jgi:ribosomal protein L13E
MGRGFLIEEVPRTGVDLQVSKCLSIVCVSLGGQ